MQLLTHAFMNNLTFYSMHGIDVTVNHDGYIKLAVVEQWRTIADINVVKITLVDKFRVTINSFFLPPHKNVCMAHKTNHVSDWQSFCVPCKGSSVN